MAVLSYTVERFEMRSLNTKKMQRGSMQRLRTRGEGSHFRDWGGHTTPGSASTHYTSCLDPRDTRFWPCKRRTLTALVHTAS